MFGQVVVGLTETAGLTGKAFAANALGATLHGPLGPISDLSSQAANAAFRTSLITHDIAMRLTRQGLLGEDRMRSVCWLNNIDIAALGTNPNGQKQRHWEAYWQSTIIVPEIPQARSWFINGNISVDELQEIVSLNGHAGSKWRQNFLNPSLPLDIGSYLEGGKRSIVTDQVVNDHLWIAGISNDRDKILAKWLTQSFPPLQQVIGWSASGLYDANFVQLWQLDAGRGPWIDRYGGLDGYGWKPSDLWANVPADVDVQWSTMLWRDHWRIMDISTAGECYRRFRENADSPGTALDPQQQIFTFQHFRTAALHAGWTPAQVDWLLGLQQQLLGRRELKALYNAGQVDRTYCTRLLQQQGYSHDDADRIVKTWEVEYENRVVSSAKAKMRSCIIESLNAGTIISDDAAIQLYRLMLINTAAIQTYDAQDYATRRQLALENIGIVLDIGAESACVVAGNAKEALKSIKKLYMLGVLDNNQLIQQLTNAGIVSTRGNQYVKLWNLERSTWRKWPSAGQLIGWYERGILPVQELTARLTAIGFNTGDIRYMIAEANQHIELQLAKVSAAAARTQAQQQRALANQVREAQKAQREAQQQLSRSASVGNLLTLVKRGLIGESQAVDELVKRGVSLNWARLRVAESVGVKVPSPLPATKQVAQVQEQLRRDATPNQILKLLKDGIINEAIARKELLAREIDPAAVDLRIAEALIPPKPKGGKSSGQPAQS